MKRILYAVLIITIFPTCLFSADCKPRSILPPKETPQEKYLIDSLPSYVNQSAELDKKKLNILVEDIKEGNYGKIHSLIIIHNDSLALEKYFMGWTRHMLHPCFSVTKSFASALIGIAIKEGYIKGVDEKLLSFFPEYGNITNLDERKKAITLENVLTMTAGLSWDETQPYFDECGNVNPENDYMKTSQSNDWIKHVLDLPMSHDPGTIHNYNSGGSHLLSKIITNKTGKTAEEFASENLFSALGITNWKWENDPNGLSNLCCGLHLHPVNMAMFGYLYLKNGFLNGKQIVPKNWVKASTSTKISIYNPYKGEVWINYGDQWWINKEATSFYASGAGGQYIYVMPSLNLIVVITADKGQDWMFEALEDITTKVKEALLVKK
jgi:CubicO group peptidase (beta-lactamase class C family)